MSKKRKIRSKILKPIPYKYFIFGESKYMVLGWETKESLSVKKIINCTKYSTEMKKQKPFELRLPLNFWVNFKIIK